MAIYVRELLEKMTLEEKVAQLGSVSVKRLLSDGKFDFEKARELLKHGIGQITRIAGWSDLLPKEVAQLANEIQRFLWKVETVFRDEKQNGGLGACQCRVEEAVKRHVGLSLFCGAAVVARDSRGDGG